MQDTAKKHFCLVNLFSFFLLVSLILAGCKSKGYDNFTTYFNTFYNEEKLMRECEDEFEFQSEKKRATPRIIVPLPQNEELQKIDNNRPVFLFGFIVDKATRQAVNTKLDSILIKGSKILAKSPKSDYVAPSLFLMAKTYFYKEEWLPSQIKCSELIDKEPTGKLSADAHLLMALNLLMQGKYDAGLTILSRTVDVAWLNNRYDILTKAFNIEAEMALYKGDLEGAIRPYFQAIAQSDDKQAKALWQNELASILFRMGKFDRAEKAYAKVMKFSPDLTTEYEAKLYRASCLIRLERFVEADKILNVLDNDGKYEEWKDYVATQRITQSFLSGNKEATKQMEISIDSTYPTSQAKTAYYFERGMKEFKEGNYIDARSAMTKAKISTPSIWHGQIAAKVYAFLNQREIYLRGVTDCYEEIKKNEKTKESLSVADTSHSNVKKDSLVGKPNNTTKNPELTKNETSNTELDTTSVPVTKTDSTLTRSDSLTLAIDNIDMLKEKAAKNYFEIARLHYNVGNIDSANYYYKVAADIVPLSRPTSSRYLYVYAESIRDTNEWKADSILNVIVNSQPRTEYGKAALSKLGYTDAFITDTVMVLYNSGYDLMKFKEYAYAKEQFKKVYRGYPQNLIYAPKALYALGYMFENELHLTDSATHYYNILIKEYPNSIYTKDLMLSMEYKHLVDNKLPIPDSLKTKEVSIYKANTDILTAPYDTTLLSKPKRKDGLSLDDLKNPSKLLEKAKKGIQDAIQQANEIIDDPEKSLNKLKETLTPDIKIPKPEDFLPPQEVEKKKEGENNEPLPENKENPDKEKEKKIEQEKANPKK